MERLVVEPPHDSPLHDDLAVGARFSLGVMASDFADIIVGALGHADTAGIDVETDDVSTLVRGSEQRVLEYLTAVIASAARSGHHVTASILLSRGCQGEVTCSPTTADLSVAEPPVLTPTGTPATAHWSLYPLVDGNSPGSTADHMSGIYAGIEYARRIGTFVRGEHYVTRLEGDLADVLATVATGWVLVGRTVQHVTSHAVLSLNSPTVRAATA